MSDSVQAFYDDLAADYHEMYADWQASICRQALALDALIRGKGVAGITRLLDCSCGIGTQAIGLAELGYQVHATDLSPEAVRRARSEAEKAGVHMEFGVADFRTLSVDVPGTFDVVLSGDNALPHLLTDADLDLALRNIRTKMKPDGLFLASIRDYDTMAKARPRSGPLQVVDGETGRRIVFQVWDWEASGRTYRVQLFMLHKIDGQWQTVERVTRYRALQRAELSERLRRAGFSEIQWHETEECGFFQPVVTAR